MSKLWYKTGNAKENSDLFAVDTSKLAISKPTVIYFPGQMSSDSRIDLISQELNQAKEIFKDLAAPPQVYLWSYPEKTEKKISLSVIFREAVNKLTLRRLPIPRANDLAAIFRVFAYQYTRQRTSTVLAREQAQKIIMPLVTDAQGKPLPLDQARNNLRNLTFLGYSVGGLSVQEVFNAALKMMRKSGFRRKDARKLLHEIVLVTVGAFAEPRREKNRYTTVAFAYTDDSLLRTREWMFHPMRRLTSAFNRRLKIKKLSKTSILVTGAILGKKRNQHKPVQKEVIEGVRLPPWRKGAFNHFFHDYVTTDDASCQFSRMAQHALINAVSRKGPVKPEDLLMAPATLEAKTKELYQRKIQRALVSRKGVKLTKTNA